MRNMIKGISAFELVYLAISIATYSHTVWASATVFEGPKPEYVHWAGSLGDFLIANFAMYSWYFAGGLIAMAVDVGMLVAARELAKRWNYIVLVAFIVAAAASFYTQIMYSLYHTGKFTYGDGVTAQWKDTLEPFVDARVIVLPLILPAFAIIYTFARISQEKLMDRDKSSDEKSLVFIFEHRVYGPFPTTIERDIQLGMMTKQVQARAARRGLATYELPVRGEDFKGVTLEPTVVAPPAPTVEVSGGSPSNSPAPEIENLIESGEPPPALLEPRLPKITVIPQSEKPATWDSMTPQEKRKWRADRRKAQEAS